MVSGAMIPWTLSLLLLGPWDESEGIAWMVQWMQSKNWPTAMTIAGSSNSTAKQIYDREARLQCT